VVEPIFEADFQPFSYGFRPGRRAHDAIAEIHYLGSRGYEWALEADIRGCFDRFFDPAGPVRAAVIAAGAVRVPLADLPARVDGGLPGIAGTRAMAARSRLPSAQPTE
jgi:RNA-directed DNA polymerase